MKLYRVTFDGSDDYVEAESFGDAIKIWRAHLFSSNLPGDFEDDVEPESVALVSDEPVLRASA